VVRPGDGVARLSELVGEQLASGRGIGFGEDKYVIVAPAQPLELPFGPPARRPADVDVIKLRSEACPVPPDIAANMRASRCAAMTCNAEHRRARPSSSDCCRTRSRSKGHVVVLQTRPNSDHGRTVRPLDSATPSIQRGPPPSFPEAGEPLVVAAVATGVLAAVPDSAARRR
jgi:hypothetical protein